MNYNSMTDFEDRLSEFYRDYWDGDEFFRIDLRNLLNLHMEEIRTNTIDEFVDKLKPCNNCESYPNYCNNTEYFEACCRTEPSISWQDIFEAAKKFKEKEKNDDNNGAN